MKRLLPAFSALFGVIAGLALGYGLAQKANDQPPAIEVAGPPEPSRPPEMRQLDLAEVARPEPPDIAAPPAKDAQPAAPSGSGEFTGKVTLRNGEPVGDVEVRCTPWVEPLADGLTPEEALNAHARRLAVEEAGARTTRTGSDGRFRLSGLDESARYAVTPHKDGYEFTLAPFTPAKFHTPGREFNFTAKAVVWVKAEVYMPDGSVAEAAQMTVSENIDRPATSHGWFWTPEKPTRGFEPGEWNINPRGGRYGECSAEPFVIRVSAGRPAPPVVIRLISRPIIVGKVKFASNLPSPSPNWESGFASVSIERADGRAIAGSARRGPPGRGNLETVNQRRPNFQFEDLEPGRHILTLNVHGKAVETKEVEVGDGITHVLLEMPDLDSADYLVIRARGPRGPVSDARFHLEGRSQGGNTSSTLTAMNLNNGEYWVVRSSIAKAREGYEYTLTATSREFGSRAVKLDMEAQVPIEIVFDNPATILVEIVGYHDHPQRAELRVTHWKTGTAPDRDDELLRTLRGEGLPTGNLRTIGPLEPGEYVVALMFGPDFRFMRNEMDRQVVRAQPGENKVQLTAPLLHSLTVTLPEELRHLQMTVQFATDTAYRQISTPGPAELLFTNLKPGSYHISVGGAGQMTVTVPVPGGRVEFRPLPFNAMRAYAFGSGIPRKETALKPGDVVLLIDGQDISDAETRRRLRSESLKPDTTTWTVLRAGQRMDVTFIGSELSGSGLTFEDARHD